MLGLAPGTAALMWVSLDEVTPLFQALGPEEIGRRMRAGLEKVLARIVEKAQFLAPADTGALKGSLAYEVLGEPLNLEGRVFSPLVQASVMEYGRRPAREIGLHPAPEGALLGWMQRHGWEMTLEAERRLRFSIAIKGIVPRPFLRPAFDDTVEEAPGILGAALFDGLAALGGQVSVEGMMV